MFAYDVRLWLRILLPLWYWVSWEDVQALSAMIFRNDFFLITDVEFHLYLYNQWRDVPKY